MIFSTPQGPTAVLQLDRNEHSDSVELRATVFVPNAQQLSLRLDILDESFLPVGGGMHPLSVTIFDRLKPRLAVPTGLVAKSIHGCATHPLPCFDFVVVIDKASWLKLGAVLIRTRPNPPSQTRNWWRNGRCQIMQLKKKTLEQCDKAAFLMMSRTDVEDRIQYLTRSIPQLQRQDEHVADTLAELYDRLIGGRDIELMTFPMENEDGK